MIENGLLTNNITAINGAPWAGALVGEDRDWDLAANVNSFATECHLLQVSSLFRSSLGSMTGRASQPQKNSCPLFTTNPSIIDLGLNLDGNVSASAHCTRGVTPDHLSILWRIDIETTMKTLEITTLLRKHEVDDPLTKNFSTNNRMLQYKRINTHFFTDTFFVTKKTKSTCGNTCMQLFVSDKCLVFVVPMKARYEFPDALELFAKEIGVPTQLIMDPSGEQTLNKSKKIAHDIGLDMRWLEESTQWANLAENYIDILKEAIRQDLLELNAPLVVWDYCAKWRARVHNLTARDKFDMSNMNPFTQVTGDVADISNMCVHKFYDMV